MAMQTMHLPKKDELHPKRILWFYG
jgi:hypothetical protein